VIDAISSWWVTTHGHNHPRIIEAVREQALRLDQVIFAGWTHQPAEESRCGLRGLMPPALTRVFFSDSGSTAVEVALKMALGFHAHTGRAQPPARDGAQLSRRHHRHDVGRGTRRVQRAL
jgi:adenosylmethionine-8-amino-7-oxononanoate aminotransferase